MSGPRKNGKAIFSRRYSPWPAARKRAKTPWRLLWRQLAETGPAQHTPQSVYLVGMNVPQDTDASSLADFNAFYTQLHVPEVMAAGGYTRGTRWELYREVAHPAPGAPRFCAIYEADADATDERDARRAARRLRLGRARIALSSLPAGLIGMLMLVRLS